MKGEQEMKTNPLNKIPELGQSIWLDFIRRGILVDGSLRRLIEEDDLRGVTSNPAIFEKAINNSEDYDQAIELLVRAGNTASDVYEELTVADVQHATDLFRSVYEKTNGLDGYVSLEVSPELAHETDKTIEEARRLWEKVDRPNVMIKVPGTKEGLPAIRQLISEGININVTLLFGLDRYKEVTDAYLSGLEDRLEANKPIDNVASVASFFLSRIDVMVDPVLENFMNGSDEEKASVAQKLHGQVAIASAELAYQIYKGVYSLDRFKELKKKGAREQRVLWASTSTKNPDYNDVKYVEALIGPETVNTIPMETLEAYRDHGNPEQRLEKGLDDAQYVFKMLPELGIDIHEVTQKLEDEGVDKFIKPFNKLMDTLHKKCDVKLSNKLNDNVLVSLKNKDEYDDIVKKWSSEKLVERFWKRDSSLWKDNPDDAKIILNALGWVDVPDKMIAGLPRLDQVREEVKKAGYEHVVHMGMGGSSLAPLVFTKSLKTGDDGLPVTVLDSTDPGTIARLEKSINPEKTLFIVASKSGSTAEPLAFMDYFFDKLSQKIKEKAGEHFVAITDPGSHLVEAGKERHFRHVFLNFEDIGGRYSALSYFGLVPASLMGLDIADLLSRALDMKNACRSEFNKNTAFKLGALIGELTLQDKDKLTFLTSASLSTLGMWLEQLVAESTGKEGKGILPVAGEALMNPDSYGDDRVFVNLCLESENTEKRKSKINDLKDKGHPVIEIILKDKKDIVQEFYRWEIVTAVAGAVIGINAFNQPNVQESKDNTNRLLKEVSEKGKLPDIKPETVDGDLKFYYEEINESSHELLYEFLQLARPGDYLSIQAYLTESEKMNAILQDIRDQIQKELRIATTIGYGPRFLHSTGQYHKGGPNTGLFIQVTGNGETDLKLPGRSYSFGVFKKAQALGDLEALRKHQRRVISIDLGENQEENLEKLGALVKEALGHHSVSI